jgi:hypothetical protein
MSLPVTAQVGALATAGLPPLSAGALRLPASGTPGAVPEHAASRTAKAEVTTTPLATSGFKLPFTALYE